MVKKSRLVPAFIAVSTLILTASNIGIVQSLAGEAQTFSGTWVANGTRETLPFGGDRSVSLVKLSGHVNLETAVGNNKDYWAECFGLTDTFTGGEFRCVWRSLDGQEMYLELSAKQLREGSSVTGSISGGSGDLSGISGTISLHWTSMQFQRTGTTTEIGGYAKDLQGTYQLP